MEQMLNEYSIGGVITVLVYLLVTKVIIPHLTKRSNIVLDAIKSNKEIEKYNAENEFRNNVIDLLTKQVSNVLQYTQAQFIYTVTFQAVERELLIHLYNIIDKNHIEDINRQKIITAELFSHLESQKKKVYRVLEGLYYNDIQLSTYVNTSTKEHTSEFITLIVEILFGKSELLQKKQDLSMLITSHYDTHTNEAIDYLKKD